VRERRAGQITVEARFGMGGLMTKWSIGLDRQVEPGDRDGEGYVSAETLGTWLTDAVDAYLGQCAALHRQASAPGRNLVRRPSRQPRASLIGRPDEVFITASATELRRTEFFISVRVRPYGNNVDLPVNITCRVSIEDARTGEPFELDQAVRDELAAIEQAAEYMS
jgi:acyl-CoA thioesterase FadM